MQKTNTSSAQSPERLLTRREVADYFSVCKETIRRWEQEEKLEPIIINARVYRYRLSDIENLLTR